MGSCRTRGGRDAQRGSRPPASRNRRQAGRSRSGASLDQRLPPQERPCRGVEREGGEVLICLPLWRAPYLAVRDEGYQPLSAASPPNSQYRVEDFGQHTPSRYRAQPSPSNLILANFPKRSSDFHMCITMVYTHLYQLRKERIVKESVLCHTT